jgi:hypothetical protein
MPPQAYAHRSRPRPSRTPEALRPAAHAVECPRCHQEMSAREYHRHKRKCPARQEFVFVPGKGMVPIA